MVPQIVDLWEKRDEILYWGHGKGQINMVPGIWDPRQVDVDMLVWRDTQDDHGNNKIASFSILWKDENTAARHMIDFKRLDFR